ncbi:MAG: hypothetical protein WA215_02475 [Candidatus Cybelea sp.]
MELRPRNLVEMFDLAVSLYGRNFLVLVGIVAVTAVPLALLQYPVTRMEQPQLDAAMRLLEHPEIAARQIPPAFNSPGALALSIVLTLLGYLVWAFCLGAIAEGVARIYAASTIEFAACWQAVLRRWLSIVTVLSLAVLAMVVCDATAVALVTIVVSLAVVIAPSSLPMMAVAAMLLVLLTATLAPALLAMPCVFGYYGCTLESLGAVAALRVSFSRIFTRAEFRRSMICATAVGTLAFGCSAVLGVFAMLGLARWTAVYVALDAVARTLLVPYVGLVLALYYFDVRIRHEGFDLESGLNSATVAGVGGEPAYAPTAYLSGPERVLVARFLERRNGFSASRRDALAARLAQPARRRVPPELQGLDDESLLERL